MTYPRSSAELIKNTSTVSPTTLPAVKDALDNLQGRAPTSLPVPIAEGGTGQITALAAFDALKQAASTTYAGVQENAVQSEMEAGTGGVTVTPDVQQFHSSALKFWAAVGVSAGTPSLAESYNVTSVTDSGTGDLTITIATDFSGTGWFETLTVASTAFIPLYWVFAKAAGSTQVRCADNATGALTDPGAYFVGGAGDQS